MAAFTSHCWKSWLERWRLCLLSLLLTLGCLPTLAASLEFRYTELVPSEQEYLLNASVNLQLNRRLQEMIEAGVALPFRVEFSLTRPRWYWINETISERLLELRLSYHALTRQYRVSVGSLHRNFASFEEACRALQSLHNWSVVDRSRLQDNENYIANLRFRLDVNALPKPFQVAALGSRDLDLDTGKVSWAVVALPFKEVR